MFRDCLRLATFCRIFFGIDVDHDNLRKIVFPTFKEALDWFSSIC